MNDLEYHIKFSNAQNQFTQGNISLCGNNRILTGELNLSMKEKLRIIGRRSLNSQHISLVLMNTGDLNEEIPILNILHMERHPQKKHFYTVDEIYTGLDKYLTVASYIGLFGENTSLAIERVRNILTTINLNSCIRPQKIPKAEQLYVEFIQLK